MKWFWGGWGIVGLFTFGLWASDVWKDRHHELVVYSATPVFAGDGTDASDGSA
jgi:hypothetical protein